MTVAAYLSPDTNAALLADTLVTLVGSPDPIGVLPSQIYRAGVTPSTAISYLSRKIYVIDQCAYAIAGCVSSARRFLEDVTDNYNAIIAAKRPMRIAGDFAESYRGEIHVVGALPTQTGNFVVSHGECFRMPNLGECWVVGSGRDDLSLLIERWDEVFSAQGHRTPTGNINALAATLSGNTLALESVYAQEKKSWGALYETCIYDYTAQRWSFGTSCLHLVVLPIEVGFDTYSMGLGDTALEYDPYIVGGMVRSVNLQNFASFVWALDDILKPAKVEESEIFDALVGWKPSTITLTFIPPLGRTFKRVTFHSTLEALSGFSYDSVGQCHLSIPDEKFDEVCERICAIWGVKYKARAFGNSFSWPPRG